MRNPLDIIEITSTAANGPYNGMGFTTTTK